MTKKKNTEKQSDEISPSKTAVKLESHLKYQKKSAQNLQGI